MELQKTGCSHIRNILFDILGGKFVGKHNLATPELFTENRVFLGSVRNPWEWYISLWAYGCDGQGGLYGALTGKQNYLTGLKSEPLKTIRKLTSNPTRSKKIWEDTYKDVRDPHRFREWLYMLHDNNYSKFIGEYYGGYPISNCVGLMTFRYLKLFCTKPNEITELGSVDSYTGVVNYERENCFIDHFIINENLEPTLIEGLLKFGENLTKKTVDDIINRPKTNTSSREKGVNYYYNEDSIELILSRDKFLINKFNYPAPKI